MDALLCFASKQTLPQILSEDFAVIFEQSFVGFVCDWSQKLEFFLADHWLEEVAFDLEIDVDYLLDEGLSLDWKPHGIGHTLSQEIANVGLDRSVAVVSVDPRKIANGYGQVNSLGLNYNPAIFVFFLLLFFLHLLLGSSALLRYLFERRFHVEVLNLWIYIILQRLLLYLNYMTYIWHYVRNILIWF